MKLNIETEKKTRIEMLPLIDIVFLLLVFFIYAMLSMAVHHGLSVDLPDSASANIEKKLILSITVKEDGAIYVNKEPVALEALIDVLKSKVAVHKSSGVLLFADQNLSYQNLFHVLDKITLAGFDNISLQAEAVPLIKSIEE